MPWYVYRCGSCGREWEEHRASDDRTAPCLSCANPTPPRIGVVALASSRRTEGKATNGS